MRLERVALRYGHRAPWVLRGTSGAVEPGRVTVLRGRNGVGKSTLLRVLAGLLRPTRGSVVDRPTSVGWAPERFPSAAPFTVREYVAAMARMRGVKNVSMSGWMERMHLVDHLDTRISLLSKGTVQKVGLIQAFLAEPDLVILDEPWEGLDMLSRAEVSVLIGEVTRRGGSVVVSDHGGEAFMLPDAVHWELVDGVLNARRLANETRRLVEVEVSEVELPRLLENLREAGYGGVRVVER